MSPTFEGFIKELQAIMAPLETGEQNFAPNSYIRGKAISNAMAEMAKDFGFELAPSTGIDTHGEFTIKVFNSQFEDGPPNTFGDFSTWLNLGSPRCGKVPTKMYPHDTWCYLNFAEAEQMVLAYYESQLTH